MRKLLIFLITLLVYSLPVFAKEGYFKPLIADVLPNVGVEHVSVNEDGSLSVFDSEGSIVGSPFVFENGVAVSDAVVVEGRVGLILRGEEGFSFIKMHEEVSEVEEAWDVGEMEMSELVVFEENVLFLRNNGELMRLNSNNGELVTLDDLLYEGELSKSEENEFVVSFPVDARVDVFEWQNGQINLADSVGLDNPLMYGVVKPDEVYYAVDVLGQLVAFDENGNLEGNFPVQLPSLAISGPVIFEEDQEVQILVELFDGQRLLFNTAGEMISELEERSFTENGLVSGYGDSLRSVVAGFLVSNLESSNSITASALSHFALPIIAINLSDDDLIEDGRIDTLNGGNWTLYGAANSFERQERDFFSAPMALYVDTLGVNGGVQYNDIQVEAGGVYSLEFRYKLSGLNGKVLLGIETSNGDFENLPSVIGDTNGSWQRVQRTFEVPEDFERDFRLVFSVPNSELYLDDIEILEVDFKPILNDGMMEEEGVSAWRRYGNPASVEKSADSFEGLQGLFVDASTVEAPRGGVQQTNLSVEAGKDYRLRFHYKMTAGEGGIQTVVYQRLGINSSNSDYNNDQRALSDTNGEWVEQSRLFSVPEDFEGDFRLVYAVRNAEFLLDNVEIEEVIPVVIDGDMEGIPLFPWKRYGNALSVEKVNESFEGEQSLFVDASTDDNPRGGVQQTNLNVEAGKDYTLSFQYKMTAGNADIATVLRPVLGINSSNSDFTGVKESLGETGDEWEYHERDFTVPEDFEGDFRLVFAVRNSATWIDDVRVVER